MVVTLLLVVVVTLLLVPVQADRLEHAGVAPSPEDEYSSAAAGQQHSKNMPSQLLKMLRPVANPRPLFLAAPGVANAQVGAFIPKVL